MAYYCECYGYPKRPPSIFDGFTLRPLPYPVLLILTVISIFLGIKFYFTADEAAETTNFHINWLLLITPLLIIFAIKLISSFQNRRKWSYYGGCPAPVKCCCYECRASCVLVYCPWSTERYKIPADMLKTALNMISRMSPKELQNMVKMASFQGDNSPFNGSPFDTNFTPGSVPPNLSLEMLKTAVI
ncbi:Outer envelope protein 61 [Bienertia sinuspersici]